MLAVEKLIFTDLRRRGFVLDLGSVVAHVDVRERMRAARIADEHRVALRMVAGVGCPQLTAVYECAVVAEESSVPVCADGGIRFPGDITIALAAGASSVMLGSMLAGTKEAPGEIKKVQGVQVKMFRGMGSPGAIAGNQDRYLAGKSGKNFVAEGVEGIVPYKGPVDKVVSEYVGGLKAGMGYVGVCTIKELSEKAEFWRITEAGKAESHPHDVTVINEPGYTP